MTRLLSDGEVRELASVERLIGPIREALKVEARGGVQIVPRINFGVKEGFFRVMPVVIEELDLMGLKAFDAKGPSARYMIAVFRPSTGELDCLVDGAYLTAARTGATTGVATEVMTADDGCLEVGVIGSGLEARTNLEGVLAVRHVEHVKVFSRNGERRERFAAEISHAFGISATAVATGAEAAAAPCVIAATNTGFNGPFALDGSWLSDGAHLNTIGGTAKVLFESDPATFERAVQVVLDTEHAPGECGDIIAAQEAGTWHSDRVSTLAELFAPDAGYNRPAGITVFKSVGTAVQDVVAAAAVAAEARVRGIGRELDILEAKEF